MKIFMGLLLSFSFFTVAETVIEDMAVYSVFEEKNTSPQIQAPPDFIDSPYAPFPWPCDSLEDCSYREHINFFEYNENRPQKTTFPLRDPQQIQAPPDFIDSPYAPFPWPCDSLEDCSYREHITF